MKNIIKFYLPLIALVTIFSCTAEEDLVTYSEGGVQKIADPFLTVGTPVVSFQAGIAKYPMQVTVINGEKAVTGLKMYAIFTDAASGKKSEKTLLKTLPVPAGAKSVITTEYTYADLKQGITVNGGGLPANDAQLAVGSGWRFSFVAESAQGEFPIAGSINVAVLSRFAGIYKILEAKYFRIGVQNTSQPDYFPGATRFIGSVDATTFSYNDFWGSFAWGGNSFRFKLDEATGKITVPILVNGALFSGDRAMSCATDSDLFTNVPCEGSNVLVKDDATGKHVIKLTYGYFTNGSGPREFYEVLEKVVNN